jgi:hypothetical protein
MTGKGKDVRTADAQVCRRQAEARGGDSILHEVNTGHPCWIRPQELEPLHLDTGTTTDFENVDIAKGRQPISTQGSCDAPFAALCREQGRRPDWLVQVREARIGVATRVRRSRPLELCFDGVLVHS